MIFDAVRFCVLAPHQCSRSWEDYINESLAVRDALIAEGLSIPPVTHIADPWYAHQGVIDAQVACFDRFAVTAEWSSERKAASHIILTAHAIPQPAERVSPYRKQIEAHAKRLHQALGFGQMTLAFKARQMQAVFLVKSAHRRCARNILAG